MQFNKLLKYSLAKESQQLLSKASLLVATCLCPGSAKPNLAVHLDQWHEHLQRNLTGS